MIWYLLYPFRGTTEPPVLSPTHPLRRAFTQYGREAARHPVITLLTSVALGVILIFPFPFLYTNNFTNGSSNLPHHVWTAAQPFEGDPNAPPDVVMRSVWIHGSYMKTLEQEVLLGALAVQDELLGPTMHFNPRREQDDLQVWDTVSNLTTEMRDSMHAINGLGNNSWFFHSPLLYWSCSQKEILEDQDIIATVNAQSRRVTSVNVTLRHSIVFSGKRFEDHRLVAADALVITLLHKLGSPVGREWEEKAEALAERRDGKWRFYPPDGRVTVSQLYEFKFQPLSLQDDLILGTAYILAVVYFLFSLTKLRAVQSRLGLIVTVMSQIAVSIMSSFTICAVLKIDLSKIPREAYPLVVLTVGLENMFRLINAVITTPSQNKTASRIGEAVGRMGHVALAGVAQNLFILWLLCKIVSPGVAAFCVFAAIALTFDFLFLLTFFVAVLSIDVRRMELSDFLNRARQRSKAKSPSETSRLQSWGDALRRGELPVSTRIAGTVVMISFVLLAQWHFFDNENPTRTILRLLRLLRTDHKPQPPPVTLLSVDVNQARTPTAWLRLQDHETAREVIQVVKPNSHSYLAQVYDPLVLVLGGSDRTSSQGGIRPFLPAVYDFVKHQSMVFVMSVIFIVATVSLLMNYLLWDEEATEGPDEDRAEDDPLLGVKTLGRAHELDVAMIATSPEGVIVSVGLDRCIFVWDLRHSTNSHIVNTNGRDINPFPVRAIAVDSSAEWLALLSASGQVMLWNITKRHWGYFTNFEMKGRSTVSFSFGPKGADSIPSLILVRSSALMTETFGFDEAPQSKELQICKSPVICARQFLDKSISTASPVVRIVTASRRGCVHVASQVGGTWVSEGLDLCWPDDDKEALSVLPLPQLQALLIVRRQAVDLVDPETQTILHTFTEVCSQPNTVRCFHRVRRHPQRGWTGIASFSLVYDEHDSGSCVVRTYTPEEENELIPIGSKSLQGESFCSWDRTFEQFHRVESPGKWVALPTEIVVGVRKREITYPLPHDSTFNESNFHLSGLRRRTGQLKQSPTRESTEDIWEAWMLSAKGENMTTPLCPDAGHGRHLLATSCGPIMQAGQRSVAIGLGNVIKVITVGNERFADEDSTSMAPMLAGRRRRLTVPQKTIYSASSS